jgi:hypothetical protein
MAHRPVGVGVSFAFTNTSAQSSAFSVKTNALRITALGSNVHVAIGTSPTATTGDYLILVNSSETLALSVASQRVVGITTGAVTIINFPEGTGSPFNVGDFVSFVSVGQSYYNFTHVPVLSIDRSSGVGGYYSTRVSIGTNTSGIATPFSSDGELRKSLKVAAISADGNGGTLYAQQVQITGDA